ncbi:hypothetical protein WD019_07950 [Fictibacillus sp. Mic-4]|uniref:hypothetical protein n=1 Tax=Fictibacillus TaxID=1329200 RepID=UPI000421B822|nr:hypothetical protein [Fictibacillus gelatini]
MVHKIIGAMIVFFCLASGFGGSTYALTFNNLPITKNTNQWVVEIHQDNPLRSNHAKHSNAYLFSVKNIGKDAENVTIEVHRNELDARKKLSLVGPAEQPIRSIKHGQALGDSRFFLSKKATEVEIVISWEDNGKKLKEPFIFTEN